MDGRVVYIARDSVGVSSPRVEGRLRILDARQRPSQDNDWGYDAAGNGGRGVWIPSAADRDSFRVTGEEIGLGVRSEVEGVMTNGEIIGVGELEEAGGQRREAAAVRGAIGRAARPGRQLFHCPGQRRLRSRWHGRAQTGEQKGMP